MDSWSGVTVQELEFHEWLALSITILGLANAIILVFIRAPYGRFHQENLGLSILRASVNGRLSWFLQEFPALGVALGIWLFASDPAVIGNLANKIVLGLFLIHYTNRVLIFPLQLKNPKPSSVFTTAYAFLFCLCNGYLQGRNLCNIQVLDDSWLTSPHFLFGTLLWTIGFLGNVQCDATLFSLRKDGDGYKIPHGGLFELVSSANYTAETLEWIGFAMAGGFNLASLSFVAFTITNLGPRAIANHKWYLDKFRDTYPKSRKAYIPFLL